MREFAKFDVDGRSLRLERRPGRVELRQPLRFTGKTQQVTKPAAVVLKACRTVMDTHTKKEHIDKWGGIHAITEAVYDCADLAQRILDAGLAMENMCAKPATSRQMILIDDLRRSLDMDDGDVEATVDPDTGEID